MNMMVSAAMLTSAAAVQPADAGQNDDVVLETLWLERQALISSIRAMLPQLHEAEASLPKWVWDAILPARLEIHKQFRAEANASYDPEGRGIAVHRYRARMRTFLARRRERDAVKAECGYSLLEEKMNVLSGRIYDVETEIIGLSPTINQVLAAALVEAGWDTLVGCTANKPTEPFISVFRVAKGLRGHATGIVAASIDRIFENPDRTLEDLEILPS